MPVSKQETVGAAFVAAMKRLDALLEARTSQDEVTEFDIEELDWNTRNRIMTTYTDMGWKITHESCPPDYEEYWFRKE